MEARANDSDAREGVRKARRHPVVREAPHVGAGLEEVSWEPLRNLSSAPLRGAEGKLGGERGGRVELGAHACRRYWFSLEVTKGRRDYVGPGPLG